MPATAASPFTPAALPAASRARGQQQARVGADAGVADALRQAPCKTCSSAVTEFFSNSISAPLKKKKNPNKKSPYFAKRHNLKLKVKEFKYPLFSEKIVKSV